MNSNVTLLLVSIQRIIVKFRMSKFICQLLIRLLKISELYFTLLQFYSASSVITLQGLILHNLLLGSFLKNFNTSLCVSYILIITMLLCLFLCFENFELVRQLIQLIGYFVFLFVQLFLSFTISHLCILTSFSVFSQPIYFKFNFIKRCFQFANLLGILLILLFGSSQLCLFQCKFFCLSFMSLRNLLYRCFFVSLLFVDDVKLALAFSNLSLIVQLKVFYFTLLFIQHVLHIFYLFCSEFFLLIVTLLLHLEALLQLAFIEIK